MLFKIIFQVIQKTWPNKSVSPINLSSTPRVSQKFTNTVIKNDFEIQCFHIKNKNWAIDISNCRNWMDNCFVFFLDLDLAITKQKMVKLFVIHTLDIRKAEGKKISLTYSLVRFKRNVYVWIMYYVWDINEKTTFMALRDWDPEARVY